MVGREATLHGHDGLKEEDGKGGGSGRRALRMRGAEQAGGEEEPVTHWSSNPTHASTSYHFLS